MGPKIEPGKLPDHAIEDIYVGNSKETLDIVGDHSLRVKEVTSMFGHFMKYRLKAEKGMDEQAHQVVMPSAFDVLL